MEKDAENGVTDYSQSLAKIKLFEGREERTKVNQRLVEPILHNLCVECACEHYIEL